MCLPRAVRDPALPQCAAGGVAHSQPPEEARTRGGDAEGGADRTRRRCPDRLLPRPLLRSAERQGCSLGCRSSCSRSSCSRSTRAVPQAAAVGPRRGATLPCSGVPLQRLGVMRGKPRTAPTRAAGAAHSPPEPRASPSQLEADYGACQGLKSSLPGVWPRRGWAGLLGSQSAVGERRGRVQDAARRWEGGIRGSLLARLSAPLLAPLPPRLHSVPTPRDFVRRDCPHFCCGRFRWLVIKEEDVLPIPSILRLLASAEGKSCLMLC